MVKLSRRSLTKKLTAVFLALTLSVSSFPASVFAGHEPVGFPERVSRTVTGAETELPAGQSEEFCSNSGPEISNDGRFVQYPTCQGTGINALYVYDREDHSTILATVRNDGVQIDNRNLGDSRAMSGDGRRVVFYTNTTDLDPNGGSSYTYSVYVHDLVLGTTDLVSVDSEGQRIYLGPNNTVDISDDGNAVLFHGTTSSTETTRRLYIHSIPSSTTEELPLLPGQNYNLPIDNSLSGDGDTILYSTSGQVKAYNRATNIHTLISIDENNNPISGQPIDLSVDGRYVLFSTGSGGGFYRRDTVNNITERASIGINGEFLVPTPVYVGAMSSDGQVVAFTYSESTDYPFQRQVYVYGFNTGTTRIASINSAGELADGKAVLHNRLELDGNGTLVVFSADSPNFGVTKRQVFVAEVDVAAPTISDPSFSINPKAVNETSTLSAGVVDNESGVQRVEYFIGDSDDDPGQGNGADMFFDGTTATVTIGTDMPVGVYSYSVRAQDNAGNWSDPQTVYLTVYDPSGGFVTATRMFTPSLADNDVLPGLTDPNQTTTAQFGATVKYQNGSLQGTNNDFMFSYQVGNGCQNPNSSCTGVSLDATTIDWLVLTDDYTKGTFQGTANVTVDGTTTSNPYRAQVFNSDHATSPSYIVVEVFNPGDDPNTATPLYRASGDITGSVNVQQL